jgi:hypothetical protein
MTTLKPLNLTNKQRDVVVTYNVNRYEVYTKCGVFLTAASSKEALKEQLKTNSMKATFDSIAQRKYLANAW